MSVNHLDRAKAYCVAIGADPNEVVRGYQGGVWCERPRSFWLIGSGPELAEGATELSPAQKRLLAQRGRT